MNPSVNTTSSRFWCRADSTVQPPPDRATIPLPWVASKHSTSRRPFAYTRSVSGARRMSSSAGALLASAAAVIGAVAISRSRPAAAAEHTVPLGPMSRR